MGSSFSSSFHKANGPVSYYSGFDDGSLCDCGSPFILYTRELPPVNWLASNKQPKRQNVMSFRPFNGQIVANFGKLKKNSGDMVYVNESTGAPTWYSAGDFDGQIRSADVPSKSCSQRPDISSLFKINYIFEERIPGNYDDVDIEYVPVEVGPEGCLLDDTYLAWHNGEPLEEETREKEAGDPSWCVAKCNANPECEAWTLNKQNGWCALKRIDQIKMQEKKNFVSGRKNCLFKN